LSNTSHTIGKYVIEQKLGHSDLGPLYLGYDSKLDRRVAIRVYEGIQGDEALQHRLFADARAMAKLDHPNIVRIWDLDLYENQPYIATEFIDGEGLETVIEKKLFIPFAQKIHIVTQICDGLHYAHGKANFHGHTTSREIRIDSEGKAKILDLGLGRADRDSKPDTGCTKHILCAGTLLYEFLTYVHPSANSESDQSLLKILSASAPELCEILDRAMGRDQNHRFSTCLEFAETLHIFRRASTSHAQALHSEVARLGTELDHYRERFGALGFVGLFDSPLSDVDSVDEDMNITTALSDDVASDYGALLHRHVRLEQSLNLLSERLKGSLPVVQLLKSGYEQFKGGEFDNCQKTLQDLLNISPRHSLAERLVKGCQSAIAERQLKKDHENRLKLALKHAREAVDREQFSRALLVVNRILMIEPGHPEASSLRDTVISRSKLMKNS